MRPPHPEHLRRVRPRLRAVILVAADRPRAVLDEDVPPLRKLLLTWPERAEYSRIRFGAATGLACENCESGIVGALIFMFRILMSTSGVLVGGQVEG